MCGSLVLPCFLSVLCFAVGMVKAGNTVQVTLYYETLCPDCIKFIANQLYNSYTSFGSQYVSLEMVPYGFVQEYDGFALCQHGPKECYGNKVHGCVLKHFSIESSLSFIHCCEASDNPALNSTFQECSHKANVPWSTVEKCFDNGEAEEIFATNGIKTELAHPQSVPHLVFNGIFNKTVENDAIIDFSGVLCKFLDNVPQICKGVEDIVVKMV